MRNWCLFLVVVVFETYFQGTTQAQAPIERIDWLKGRLLYPGVVLIQRQEDRPRPMRLHLVRVDLRTPGLRLWTTPRLENWKEGEAETIRETTRDFIRRTRSGPAQIVLAVNANSFSPWPAPWNGMNPVDIGGLAVNREVVVSPPFNSPSFIIDHVGQARIRFTEPTFPTAGIVFAVSGMTSCLIDGKPVDSGSDLHPRTGIGLSVDGRYLVIAVIDGRTRSSRGATVQELGCWLKSAGADDGMNMDGGGSSTLAWWNPASKRPDKCELINSPVGSRLSFESSWSEAFYFPTERTVGNNLGIYFEEEKR